MTLTHVCTAVLLCNISVLWCCLCVMCHLSCKTFYFFLFYWYAVIVLSSCESVSDLNMPRIWCINRYNCHYCDFLIHGDVARYLNLSYMKWPGLSHFQGVRLTFTLSWRLCFQLCALLYTFCCNQSDQLSWKKSQCFIVTPCQRCICTLLSAMVTSDCLTHVLWLTNFQARHHTSMWCASCLFCIESYVYGIT